jgi:hypothetical protein
VGVPPVILDARDTAAAEDATAVAAKPTILALESNDTPAGPVEVSNATFAESVIDHLPDDALVFRLGDVLGALYGEPGSRRFHTLDVPTAQILIDRTVRIVKTRRDAEGVIHEKFCPCKKDWAGVFLSEARTTTRIRTIRCIVQHPVYLPGFDIAKPGWNAKGGVFYDAPEHLSAVAPDVGQDTETAMRVLEDLVADFPFKDEASRQNVFALMLTRVLRPAIEGPTPFFFVMASLERTGKGKLLDTASLAVTGERMVPMQIGGDEDEREKRITSLILRGAQSVHFDNVPTGVDLDSASIASLATAWPSWSGRILGASALPSLPNSLVVAFSGNNPKASGENAKRSVPIVLESRTDHPESRDDFLHPDCYAYALERRPSVLGTLLGMVERWKAAGRPKATKRLGGFERWAEAVVGILVHAGARMTLENYAGWVSSSNDFGADAEAFLTEANRLHGADTFSAKQAFQIAEDVGLFQAYYGGKNDRGRMTSFGMKILTPLVDRPVATGKLRKSGTGSNAVYHVQGANNAP